jgi:hypothetical protein
VAVYPGQIFVVLRIVASARKIAAENHTKMMQAAVVGIDGSSNHYRNGSAHILDKLDVEN